MAQERAKSPSTKATPEAKDEAKGPLGAMMAEGKGKAKSEETPKPERSAQMPRRSTLADRLKAEQHKREEPKSRDLEREEAKPQSFKREEEAKPTELPEATVGAPSPKSIAKTRRPAGPPPQRRLAAPANDDVPSIGGLIFALQQRPSRTPFLVALIASAVWFVVGGFFAYGVIANQVLDNGLLSASALSATAAILVPIVVFWVLALLAWRAQELRLMASAMTEVAVRLAEPDKLAEQSVASVGQTIRRQVAAMNDAISRAIGRASELESMVHSEVAALERSYGENELRVRNLINELATERGALTNNSQRVSEALKGVGAQVARDISNASGSIDKKLSERGAQLTELLVSRSTEAAEQVHKAQAKVTEAVPGLLERLTKEQGRLTKVIDGAAQNLSSLETVVAERTTNLDKTMKERTEALQSSLAERIKGMESTVAQGAIVLDKTLKERAETFMAEIGKSTETLDKALQVRTDTFTGLVAEGAVTLDKTLTDNTAAFTNVVAESAVILDQTLTARTAALTNVVAEGAVTLDKTLKDNTTAFTNVVAESAVVLDKTLADRTDAFTGIVSQGVVAFDKTLTERTEALATVIDDRASSVDKTLADRTSQFTSAVNQGAIALDQTLAERADTFTKSLLERVKGLEEAITEQTASLDKTLAERAQLVVTSLAARLGDIDGAFGERTAETNTMLSEHTRMAEETFGKQTEQLNQILANNSQMMQQTAEQVGAQSKEAVGILTSQTENLRDVSRGLLDQIHGLTQRFESQGQAILTAAKALDSSNAKIDSILEGRHHSIVALLHTVNSKAQELDGMMGNYAGIVEGALTQAETRAKQVTAALGRDTTGQAQQALAQIEKLRQDAQAHTAGAVADLKSSFETVITQVGKQLEQMRGQFDNSSRSMRDTARKTATDLDALRQEMQKRMDVLPEQTTKVTASIRKAITEQFQEIEALAPTLPAPVAPAPAPAALAPTLPAPVAPVPAPAPAANVGGGVDPYQQQPQPFPPRADAGRPASEYGLPPMPRFDASGRQVSPQEAADLNQTAGLAQQLSGTTAQGNRPIGDLIARTPDQPGQAYGGAQNFGGGLPQGGVPQGGVAPSIASQLRIDELARAIDPRTATDVWHRMRAGERGVLGRHIYSYEGQTTFEEVSTRYDRDGEFRNTVDRYIGDFERLLAEAEQSDPAGQMLQNYLASETGRVYLLLAHASGRLR